MCFDRNTSSTPVAASTSAGRRAESKQRPTPGISYLSCSVFVSTPSCLTPEQSYNMLGLRRMCDV